MQKSGLLVRDGLRLLSAAECRKVAGGTEDNEIVVTGSRPVFTPDYAGMLWVTGGTGDFTEGYEQYEPGTLEEMQPDNGEGMFSEEVEDALGDLAEGLAALLESYIAKYGDFTLKLPDGSTYKASSLVKGAGLLGAALNAHEGFEHYQDLMNGNLDVAAFVGFVGGIAVGFGAASLGAGPLAAFALSLGVSYGIEYGLPAIASLIETGAEQVGMVIDDAVSSALDGQYDPDAPSSFQLYQVLIGAFGGLVPSWDDVVDPDGDHHPY